MTELTIAIVGHTNTGKTSLVRALTHERNFGEVNDAPSTTIDATLISLISEKITLNFIDTPGIEDAIGLLELLESKAPIHSKKEERERLIHFIDDPEMRPVFEQEIKILKQLITCDLAFYVIDTRLPFLPKFDYELHLILQAHKPLLPILNFLSDGKYLAEWKTHLKAHGLHHFIEYDTIVLSKKKRLYEQIAIMFPEHYEAIQNFIVAEERKQQEREASAYLILSDFYINLMSLQIKTKKDIAKEKIAKMIQTQVGLIENRAIDELLALYHFNAEDIEHLSITLSNTKLEQDFFTTDSLIDFSMQFGKGAATGAGIFAGIDALTAFTTLGAATATGAILGGVTNTIKHYGGQFIDYWQDIEIFCISDHALLNLNARMMLLIELLNGRSHAEIEPILLSDKAQDSPRLNQLLEKTQFLRGSPSFCQTSDQYADSKARKKAQAMIQKFFLEQYENINPVS